MSGKEKCEQLKEVRKTIAKENGIEFEIPECTHEGECAGTCEQCDREIKYLDEEIKKKKKIGKAIAIVGVATVVTVGAKGCATDAIQYALDTINEQSTSGAIAPGIY